MKHKLLLLISALLLACSAGAQCPVVNTAFKSGEHLDYDLYFNWKFIWKKVGTASMKIDAANYNNKPGYVIDLLTKGSKQADFFFKMRDTLTCYVSEQLEPLYFRKASVEGKKYRLSQVWYNYLDSVNVEVSQSFLYCDEPVKCVTDTLQRPVYDMMSLLAYARTIDFTSLKKGTRLTFPIATGKRIENQYLVYRDKKRTKSDHSIVYNCYRVSLITEDDGEEKEIVNFHVTDDKNHLPVLLDLALNFGSAKAKLLSMDGLLHRISSVAR